MDKYMERARREAERFWYAFSVELRSRYCQEEVEQHPDSPVAQFCRSRASELRMLDMLRRAVTELAYVQESPTLELCQTSEGASIVKEGTALLAEYKDVKTD